MLLSKPQVLDDRGRRVGVFKLTRDSAREDAELSATMTRVHESTNLMHEKVGWEHLLYILLGVGVMAAGIYIAQKVPGLPPWTTGIIAASGWIMIALMLGSRTRHRYAHRIVESALRIGRCPTCGYRLRGSPVDDAGVIACPECASAWNAARVGESEVPAADIPPAPDMPGDTRPVGWSLRYIWTRLPTVVDDRDRSMSLVDPRLGSLQATVGTERAEAVRRALRARLRSGKLMWITVASLFLLLMFVPYLLMFFRMSLSAMSLVMLLMPLFWLFAGSRVLWRLATGRSRLLAKSTVGVLVEHRLCASCGRDLMNRPVETDGCVVCPGCRAAWKARG